MDLHSKWVPNPILVKELRSRMRGARAFVILTSTLLLMGVVGYALYRMALASSQNTSSPASPQVGQILFAGLAILELMIIASITPAITAGEISGEREKQTYEMLLTTPLSPSSILWGKLVTAMSYVFLLIFAAIPMASLVFVYGGISIRDMVKTFVVLIVIAIMFGVIGLFFSTLLGRSGRATVLSYLVISILMFGPLFVAILIGVMKQSEPSYWTLIYSPFTVLVSAFSPSINAQRISSTFWMLGSPINWLLGIPPISLSSIPRPAYHIGLPLYGLITIFLYFISSRMIKPIYRWRIHWSDVALALVVIFCFTGLIGLGYLATTSRYENIRIITPSSPTPITPLELEVPISNPGDFPQPQTSPVSPYPAPKGEAPLGIEYGLEKTHRRLCPNERPRSTFKTF